MLPWHRQAVEAVRLGAFAKHPAVFRIHHQRLGRLRPTINADNQFSHMLRVNGGRISQRRRETNTGGVWWPVAALIRPAATFSPEGKRVRAPWRPFAVRKGPRLAKRQRKIKRR